MAVTRRTLAALGVALLAAFALGACGTSHPKKSLPANVVAEVGSIPITKAAYEHWLRITAAQRAHVPAARAPIPVPPNYRACIASEEAEQAKQEAHGKHVRSLTAAELKRKCAERFSIDHQLALSFLIGDAWLRSEAAHLGVKVSNAQVHKEFAKLKKQQFKSEAAFRRYLNVNGYTTSDLMMKTRDELLRNALGKKVLAKAEAKPITKKAVANYYKRHTAKAFHPESKGVQVLLAPSEAQAKAAKAQIESGQSFASVAKRVSIFHAAGKHGTYMVAVRGHSAKALETAIWGLKPNVLTGPIKSSQGYYLLELKRTMPAYTEPLHKAEDAIRLALRSKYIESALHSFPKRFTAKWTAKTTCRAGYVVEQCKEYKS